MTSSLQSLQTALIYFSAHDVLTDNRSDGAPLNTLDLSDTCSLLNVVLLILPTFHSPPASSIQLTNEMGTKNVKITIDVVLLLIVDSSALISYYRRDDEALLAAALTGFT